MALLRKQGSFKALGRFPDRPKFLRLCGRWWKKYRCGYFVSNSRQWRDRDRFQETNESLLETNETKESESDEHTPEGLY